MQIKPNLFTIKCPLQRPYWWFRKSFLVAPCIGITQIFQRLSLCALLLYATISARLSALGNRLLIGSFDSEHCAPNLFSRATRSVSPAGNPRNLCTVNCILLVSGASISRRNAAGDEADKTLSGLNKKATCPASAAANCNLRISV